MKTYEVSQNTCKMSYMNGFEHFHSKRIHVRKNIQNVVFLMGPTAEPSLTPLKVGNMYLNRFAIDEEAAFELSGVHYLEPEFNPSLIAKYSKSYFGKDWLSKREIKGKGIRYNLNAAIFIQNKLRWKTQVEILKF